MAQRNKPISFEMRREYNNNNSKGKISEIIDFHLHGKNRYMKINQPSKSLRYPIKGKKKFKNPILNKYDHEGIEEYDKKRFIFGFQEDDYNNNSNSNNNNNNNNIDVPPLDLSNNTDAKLNKKSRKKNSNQVDQEKVGEAVKLLETLLKNESDESFNKKKSDSIDEKQQQQNESTTNKNSNSKKKKKKNLEIDEAEGEEEDDQMVSDEEKDKFLEDRNIRPNLSTLDNDDPDDLVKKPKKKNLKRKLKEYKTKSTQTPRELFEELMKDNLQHATNSNEYVNNLIDNASKVNKKFENQEDPNKTAASTSTSKSKKSTKSSGGGKQQQRDDNKMERTDESNEKNVTSNSLGLAMTGKEGFNMAIVKSKERKSSDGSAREDRHTRKEVIGLKKNIYNLQDLINYLMQNDPENNYLRIAKLYRLKVLNELSLKLVGRKYKEISDEERTMLDLEANRYHTTYPLPGEEIMLEELNENGEKVTRMPLKVVEDEGKAKIDVNTKYLIDPADFLKLYTEDVINHAKEINGMMFDNITIAIPAAYGTRQREALKNSLKQASNGNNNVQILTRPVAAAVMSVNQREQNVRDQDRGGGDEGTSSASSISESFKVVFDMTETSLDASVICVKDNRDYHVLSNVGDTSYGLNDFDERILEHIISEKSKLSSKSFDRRVSSDSAHNIETVNAYSNLIKKLKRFVQENGAATVDLTNMQDLSIQNKSETSSPNELQINKNLISEILCKDIYDWSYTHMEKAISQANISDKDVDEIIVVGSKSKMPGFYEYLKAIFPNKTISFIEDQDLASGAAIVGRKLKYQKIKITEVLCRSIGIGLYTGVITFLLYRNSSLPCKGGCVYSTLVDNQESMVLDIYEGERPHVKFCRYLGEVRVIDLPKGQLGSVKCEVHIEMNHEGILSVVARDLHTGKTLQTAMNANPENLKSESVNNFTDLDPIEAERFKKRDYDLVYELEALDEYLENLNHKYRNHQYSKFIIEKILDTKEWVYKNRRNMTTKECKNIRILIKKFLKNMKSIDRDQ